jgi:hypothetical protein
MFIGVVVLLACVMAALIFAFEEYFTVGEFFALRDIQHHESFEVTALPFGLGVFFSAVGFGVYHRNQTVDLIQYPTMIPAQHPYPVPYDPTRQRRQY